MVCVYKHIICILYNYIMVNRERQYQIWIKRICQTSKVAEVFKSTHAITRTHSHNLSRALNSSWEVTLSAGADVVRASLGGTTLLGRVSAEDLGQCSQCWSAAECTLTRSAKAMLEGSHAIVILQHYLDEHMHRCEAEEKLLCLWKIGARLYTVDFACWMWLKVAKQVDYSRGR